MCRSNSSLIFHHQFILLRTRSALPVGRFFRAGNPTTVVVMADHYAALAAQLSAVRRQLAAGLAEIKRAQARSARIEQSHEHQQQHVQQQREQQQAASRAS